MGIILTILLGGLAGWLASIMANRDKDMGVLMNVIVGILGAMLSNWLIAPLLDTSASLDTVSFSGFAMSVLGATILLFIVNFITKKSIR